VGLLDELYLILGERRVDLPHATFWGADLEQSAVIVAVIDRCDDCND
jgi:hypothetical protein